VRIGREGFEWCFPIDDKVHLRPEETPPTADPLDARGDLKHTTARLVGKLTVD
jgi:hypothetical protein